MLGFQNQVAKSLRMNFKGITVEMEVEEPMSGYSIDVRMVTPAPCTLHPAPCTLHPAP